MSSNSIMRGLTWLLNLRHGAGVINRGGLPKSLVYQKYNFILTIMKIFKKMYILKRSRACVGASLLAQTVKNLPLMQETQETWVQSLGWEDLLGEENGYPLQYSCLGNPMDRGAWEATVHGVTKSRA